MQRTMKTVTFSIPVEIYTNQPIDINLDTFGEDLQYDGFQDGRHPFYREMLGLAMSKMLECSLGDTILKHFTAIYGNEMVVEETADSRSETSRAYKEMWAWMDKHKPTVTALQEDWQVSSEDR